MQIQRQHAIGAGFGDQVGDQLGADGRTGRGFTILPGVAEIGDHRGFAPRRTAPQRVQHDQQFHQVVVGGEARALDDEHILATDIFLDFDEHLHVGEAADRGAGQWQLQASGDGFGQRPVAVAGDNLHGVSGAGARGF